MRARVILHLSFIQEKLQWRSTMDKFQEHMKRFLLTKTKEANWTESITCERLKLEAVIWTGAKSRWVQAHASSRRNKLASHASIATKAELTIIVCQANQKDQCLSKRRRKFEITLVLCLECLG